MISKEDGIKAIMFFQKLAEIWESEESARIIWDGLSDLQKEEVMAYYEDMKERTGSFILAKPIVPEKGQ